MPAPVSRDRAPTPAQKQVVLHSARCGAFIPLQGERLPSRGRDSRRSYGRRNLAILLRPHASGGSERFGGFDSTNVAVAEGGLPHLPGFLQQCPGFGWPVAVQQ